MIDHLVFGQKDWFQDDDKRYMKNYVGKKITKYAYATGDMLHSDGTFNPNQSAANCSVGDTIIFQLDIGDGNIYVAVDHQSRVQFFNLTQMLQNGGVLGSHLTHLYQAFKRAFTRNEMIACL